MEMEEETYGFDDLNKPTEFIKGDLEGRWPCQGKCDLRDHLCMIGRDESQPVEAHILDLLKNTTFYVENFILKSDTIQDIAPYMFSLVWFGSFSKNEQSHVHITKRPYIDSEEFESLMLQAERIYKYFQYIKSKKRDNPNFTDFLQWNSKYENFSRYAATDRKDAYYVMFSRYLRRNFYKEGPKGAPKASKEDLCKDLHYRYKTLTRIELVDFLIGIGCSKNHPMIQKYITDIYWYYATKNHLMDAGYDARHEFTVQFDERVEKRGWK